MKSGRKRYSWQQQQESKSRQQFAERLEEYAGWPSASVQPDLGEDFLVRIYDGGQSSGLSFYVQLKSTADVDGLASRHGWLGYPVSTADLEHWAGSMPPVVFVVWDVNRRCGYWSSVPDAISELDDRKPQWRRQKRVRVRIPLSNGTDDVGLLRLRWAVACHCYPSVSQGGPLEGQITFAFPDTAEGRKAEASLQRHFAAGDPVEIDGCFIEAMTFPGWWSRLFGPVEASGLALGPRGVGRRVPVRLDLRAQDGSVATLAYVDLRVAKGGFDEVTLSNEHCPVPLGFRFVLRRSDRHFEMTMRVAGLGENVTETRELLAFLASLAQGGTLRMTLRENGAAIEAEVPSGLADPPNPAFASLVDKLCIIQDKTGCVLSFRDNWPISQRDVRKLDYLMTILERGLLVRHDVSGNRQWSRDELERLLENYGVGQPIALRIETESNYEEILGVQIQLGPLVQFVAGAFEMPVSELREVVASLGPADRIELPFVATDIAEVFPKWVPRSGD